MKKRVPQSRAVYAALTIGFSALMRILPLPLAYALALLIAKGAYYAVPRIRRVGFENLDRVYGDSLSPREKAHILRGAVNNLAYVVAEFSRTPKIPSERFRQRHIRMKGIDAVDLSRGNIFISAHVGNWEWLAPALASVGSKVVEVVRPMDDPSLDAVVDRTRRAGGIDTIPSAKAGRDLIRLVKEGWQTGLLIDQDARKNAAPTVFLGTKCWSTIGSTMLAARTKAPVHPVAMIRDAPGKYTMHFHPAIELKWTKNPAEDIVENTQRCQDAIEAIIRAYPEQWLWFHRRWKAHPGLDEKWGRKLARRERKGARDETQRQRGEWPHAEAGSR